MLQFNFKKAHITEPDNTSADFFSKLKLIVTEKIRLENREDIQATPLEVTAFSLDFAKEEQFFSIQADNEIDSEEQNLQREEQSWQDAKE